MSTKSVAFKPDELSGTKTIPKKKLEGELAKTFDPTAVETEWYNWWDSEGFFAPADHKAPSYTLLIPPPNVTGSLHLGHALTTAVQDTLVRWHRMCGHNTLYIPGTDHAGIATQVQVERRLMKDEGIDRHALGREAFLERVWDWKNQYGNRIMTQFRRIATSVDWQRTFFTLDGPRAASVQEAFLRLANRGKIYRATRLVHWCCTLRSAISDVEVEHETVKPKSLIKLPGYEKPVMFGYLLYFAYPVAAEDGSGPCPSGAEVVVATTRPETILADVAVAVHPEDARYTHLHGRRLCLPFREGTIPLVLDGTLAKMEFGTGAVKVTPAHDHNDFECGKRNGLPVWSSFTEDGHIISDPQLVGEPSLRGLKRFDAREAIYQLLLAKGLVRDKDSRAWTGLDKEGKQIVDPKTGAPITACPKDFGKVPHELSIATCQRTHDIIEPFLKPQWYVDCTEMADRTMAAVEAGKLRLVPEDPHRATLRHWLTGIHPWCVSRQLWWGHRIPAWRVTATPSSTFAAALEASLAATPAPEGTESDGRAPKTAPEAARRVLYGEWVVAADAAAAVEKFVANAKAAGLDVEGMGGTTDLLGGGAVTVEQDPDVLDTWFSSGLLPFSACGWPNETVDMSRFFPGALLETGHDIIFFWVARMVMLSLEFTDKLPFHTVYLHAMVRDKDGQKMSKTKGNVLDPLDFIEGISLEEMKARIVESNLPASELDRALKMQDKYFAPREGRPEGGIATCGSDALRYGLLAYTASGRSVNLDPLRVEGYRMFGNKLWNVIRFAIYHSLGADYVPPTSPVDVAALNTALTAAHPADAAPIRGAALIARWILSRLGNAVADAEAALASYNFAALTHTIYKFIWDEFADWFIELSKPIARAEAGSPLATMQEPFKHVLWSVLDTSLRLLHPLMPFVTEELWNRLPGREVVYPDVESIMVSAYPRPLDAKYAEGCHPAGTPEPTLREVLAGDVPQYDAPRFVPAPEKDDDIEARFNDFIATVRAVRSVRSDYNVTKPDTLVVIAAVAEDGKVREERVRDLVAMIPFISAICGVKDVKVGVDAASAGALTAGSDLPIVEKPAGSATSPILSGGLLVHVVLAGSVDAAKEVTKCEQKLAAAEKSCVNYEKMSKNEKAPANVRQMNIELLAEKKREIELIKATLADFRSMLGYTEKKVELEEAAMSEGAQNRLPSRLYDPNPIAALIQRARNKKKALEEAAMREGPSRRPPGRPLDPHPTAGAVAQRVRRAEKKKEIAEAAVEPETIMEVARPYGLDEGEVKELYAKAVGSRSDLVRLLRNHLNDVETALKAQRGIEIIHILRSFVKFRTGAEFQEAVGLLARAEGGATLDSITDTYENEREVFDALVAEDEGLIWSMGFEGLASQLRFILSRGHELERMASTTTIPTGISTPGESTTNTTVVRIQ